MAATIYGWVRDSATNTNITNASVTAPPFTVNCSNGNYSFMTPGASTVTITASAPDYITQQKTTTVSNGQIKQVNFLLVHV